MKIQLEPVGLIDSGHGVTQKSEFRTMQKFLRQRGTELAAAIVCLAACATQVYAYQSQQVGDLHVTFHATPDDRPIANQPSDVWIQIKQGDAVVLPSACQNCRLSLLAPDGQLLNQFEGDELQHFETATGAFGTTMIFGASGDFLVQLEGTVNQQSIDILFPVPVRE